MNFCLYTVQVLLHAATSFDQGDDIKKFKNRHFCFAFMDILSAILRTAKLIDLKQYGENEKVT